MSEAKEKLKIKKAKQIIILSVKPLATHCFPFISIVFAFHFLLFTFSGCLERHQPIYKKKIAVKQLQEDFKYYRMILESAHPGLYQFTSVNTMKHLFDSTYQTLDGDMSIFGFFNKLSFITNEIRCAHTSLFLPESVSDSLDNTDGFFPVPLLYVQGKLLVNSEMEDDLPLGSQVISINNEPVEKIMAGIEMYESVDGYVTQFKQEETALDFAQNYFLGYGPQKTFVVKYINQDTKELNDAKKRNNPQHDSSRAVGSLQKKNINKQAIAKPVVSSALVLPRKLKTIIDRNYDERFYAFPDDVDYDLDLWDSIGTARMNVHTFGFDTYSTDRAFTHFLKNSFRLLSSSPRIRNLIIDMRNNTGGNFRDMFNLYSYLTNRYDWREFSGAYTVFNRIPFVPYLAKASNDVEGIQASLDSSFKYHKLGRIVRQYTDNGVLHKAKTHFAGNVFVITNTNVQSAAAYFAALLKDEGRGQIIGSETGGSGSSTNSFHILAYELPNTHIRLNVPVVHASFYLQNKKHIAGRGVIPDHTVTLSLTDLKENNDPQLSYILDSLIN